MPAISGEPFRGLAKVHLDEAAGDRYYTVSIDDVDPVTAAADQSTWEGAPGSSVLLRLEWAIAGVPTNLQAVVANITLRLPGGAAVGATVWSPAITGDSGSATQLFHFDDNPANGTANNSRWGALEIFVDVLRNSGVGQWNADSRGGGTGFVGTLQNARGYLRAPGTLASHSISNVAVAGAEPGSWAFPDPVHTRVTFAEQAYESFSATLSILRGGGGSSERSESLSGAGPNRDYSWTGTTGNNRRIGNGMQAASELKDLRVALAAADFGGDNKFVLAASGHQANWTRDSDLQITRGNRITVDPRLTATHLFQLDDNAFATPPMASDEPNSRLVTQQGFLAQRLTNARAEGQNSVTHDISLTPVKPGTTLTSSGLVTSTQGGEAGWAPSFLAWSSSLPDGTWNKATSVTAPSDITGSTFLVDSADAYTLVAVDPGISVRAGLHAVTADEAKRHRIAGDTMRLIAMVINTADNVRVVADSGTVTCSITRYSPVLDRLQYLNSDTDNTSACWTTWDAATALPTFAMAVNPSDAALYSKDFSATDGWGVFDIRFGVALQINGTPYAGFFAREITGADNQHDGYGVDPVGLALSGKIGMR